jgi:ribose transport system substrate-binding protein
MRSISVLAVAAVTLAGCGTRGGSGSDQPAANSGTKKVGVSVADQKSLFYIAAVDGMKKAAAENGVELVVLSADNNSTQQVNQVNDLITQKVGALIFIAQDATAAAAGVRAANRANIPVVAVDQKPESGQGKLQTYIATDSVKAADALCTWLFKQMGDKGELGILQGVLGSTAELQRSKGCQQALSRTPGVKVVAKQSANWDETQGYKAAQNMLQANRTSRRSSARVTRWASERQRPRGTPTRRSSPWASTASRP